MFPFFPSAAPADASVSPIAVAAVPPIAGPTCPAQPNSGDYL